MPPEPQPFRVLYVCTGNICRSPVAERLLRLRLRERLGKGNGANGANETELIEVESAGVQGVSGATMDEDAAATLKALGGDCEGFVARKLDADQIRRADLILTANRKHRSTVVRLDASAARRTFTIREFARLAEQFDPKYLPDVDPSTRLQAVVEEIAASRGTIRPDEGADFDIEDPYGEPPSLHRRITAQIDAATTTTTDLLVAAVRPPPRPPSGAADPPPEPAPPASKRKVRRLWLLLVVAVPVVALLAALAWLAWTGLSAKRELEASRPLVSQARQQVLDGDTTAAKQTVSELQGHTSKARSRTNGPLWSLAEKAPFLGDDVTAVRTVTRAVDDVAQQILPPLVAMSDTIRPEKLRTAGDRINLAPLQQAAPTLRNSATQSQAIKTQVDDIRTPGLTGPVARAVADVRQKIDDLANTTASAARAAELIPPMLGADGKRRYFLAFQNPAESRGTGGLLGAYGVLEADQGRLRVRHLGPNTELTNPAKLPIDLGADFRALYGRTPPWWVNGNISPHFPDAGRIWTAMWRQEFHQDLDGVIATDPVALGYMLKATGPAALPGGGQITAANAVALTMKDVYARYPSRRARTRSATPTCRVSPARCSSGCSRARATPRRSPSSSAKAAGEGRLLVYSTHAQEQRQLEQTSLAGAVPDDGAAVRRAGGQQLLGQQARLLPRPHARLSPLVLPVRRRHERQQHHGHAHQQRAERPSAVRRPAARHGWVRRKAAARGEQRIRGGAGHPRRRAAGRHPRRQGAARHRGPRAGARGVRVQRDAAPRPDPHDRAEADRADDPGHPS